MAIHKFQKARTSITNMEQSSYAEISRLNSPSCDLFLHAIPSPKRRNSPYHEH